MHPHIRSVALEKAYRLLNHGPTVLISSHHDGVDNVMAAAWVYALDFAPPRLTVVLGKQTATRALIEASGRFVVQVPTVALLDLTNEVGNRSLARHPDKLLDAGAELLRLAGDALPFVAGCSAWLECRLIPQPHNQACHDLFIGEVAAAWADDRVFRDGHWHFESADPAWRSIHHVAGGHFYAIGEPMRARGPDDGD